MTDDLIQDDVRQFIFDRIHSIAQLECLLLLHDNPEVQWSVETLAQRLYINQQQAKEVLSHLTSEGLLIAHGESPVFYQYQTNPPHLNKMVDRLAEAYSKYLIQITNLIHSKPQSRIQEFAEAFRLRKRRDV
jgi:predicted ArsR family transcriptional regulator